MAKASRDRGDQTALIWVDAHGDMHTPSTSTSGNIHVMPLAKLLGHGEGDTAFDDLPYPTRPFYHGKPWFLASAVAWYRLRDRMAR